VVNRSETQLGPQVCTEFLEVGAIKLLAVIHGDFVRHAEAAYDVLPEVCIVAEVMLNNGFASTHLEKYSTATTA
jgi:hypothetical protein